MFEVYEIRVSEIVIKFKKQVLSCEKQYYSVKNVTVNNTWWNNVGQPFFKINEVTRKYVYSRISTQWIDI